MVDTPLLKVIIMLGMFSFWEYISKTSSMHLEHVDVLGRMRLNELKSRNSNNKHARTPLISKSIIIRIYIG